MANVAHLNALRAFEASARHQSFSAAAAELNVTPAAVGQLVRTLEQWLGAPLFLRGVSGKTRLITTEAGERALPDIRAGLERLALGLDRMKQGALGGVLTVTVSPAFAAKWLLPRIDGFHTACPDTDVRLDTQLRAVDFLAQRIDIGVRYGAGDWPGLVSEKLMEEEVYPVCSPVLLARSASLRTPADLAHETLIHDQSMDGHAGFATWETWLHAAGVADPGVGRGMKINNSASVLQAAIDGLGVALARSVMARDDVAAGRLVRLVPHIEFASPLAYYVVYRPECATLPKVRTFREWLFKVSAS